MAEHLKTGAAEEPVNKPMASLNIGRMTGAQIAALNAALEAAGIDAYELEPNGGANGGVLFRYPADRVEDALGALAEVREAASRPTRERFERVNLGIYADLAENKDAPPDEGVDKETQTDGKEQQMASVNKGYTPYADLTSEQRWQVDSGIWLERTYAAYQGLGIDKLVDDPVEDVRKAVAEQGYGLHKLIDDPSELVRQAIAEQGYGLRKLIDDPSNLVRRAVAEQGYRLEELVDDPSELVRKAVAEHWRGRKNDGAIESPSKFEEHQTAEITEPKRFDGVSVSIPKQIGRDKDSIRTFSYKNKETGEERKLCEVTLPAHARIGGADASFHSFIVKESQVKEFGNDPNYYHVVMPRANRDGEVWDVRLTRDFGGWEHPEAKGEERGAWVEDERAMNVSAIDLEGAMRQYRDERREFAQKRDAGAESQAKKSPAAAKGNAEKAASSRSTETPRQTQTLAK